MDVLYRSLVFTDLNEYKSLLLTYFPKGFVGILFKEICDNPNGCFYTRGAFVNDKLIGFIVGIKEYSKVRQLSEFEHGLTAVTGKKLAFIPALVVHSDYHRQKIGSTLINSFLETVPNGATFVYFPHKNISAEHFFKACGFQVNSTLRKYYDEFEDALVFVKSSQESE